MWKKFLLSALALGFATAANMQLCCSLWVDGQRLDGLYTLQGLDRGLTAAHALAEEISAGSAVMPELKQRYALSFLTPSSSTKVISAAVLDSVEGVAVNQGVYVNNVYLGSVASRETLYEAVRQYISNQLPSWAEYGYLSKELVTKPQYGRSDGQTSVDDMVLLISGMAPVMYSDGNGYVARA